METKDIVIFMDNINTVISFIESSLKSEELCVFRLKDVGDEIRFTIQRGKYDVPIEEIADYGEDTLRIIYASIAAKYQHRMEIGSTMEYKDKEIQWNLAPVIADKTLVEFISSKEKDQKWFYEELEKSTKVKGLR